MLGAPGCNERAVGGGKQSQQLAPPCHCIVQVLCVLFPVPCCAIISRQHWSVNSPSRLTHGHQKPPKLSSSFGNFRFAWKWDCVCIAVIHYAMEERQKLVKEEEEEIVVDIKLEEEKNYPPKVSRRGALKLITPLQLLSCQCKRRPRSSLLPRPPSYGSPAHHWLPSAHLHLVARCLDNSRWFAAAAILGAQ